MWALKNKCCPVQFWIGLDLHLFLSFARECSTVICMTCLQDFKRLFPYLFVTMENIKQQTLSNFLFASSFLQRKKILGIYFKERVYGGGIANCTHENVWSKNIHKKGFKKLYFDCYYMITLSPEKIKPYFPASSFL